MSIIKDIIKFIVKALTIDYEPDSWMDWDSEE